MPIGCGPPGAEIARRALNAVTSSAVARAVAAAGPLLALAALRAPLVTRLARALRPERPVPLTLEEVLSWNAPRS